VQFQDVANGIFTRMMSWHISAGTVTCDYNYLSSNENGSPSWSNNKYMEYMVIRETYAIVCKKNSLLWFCSWPWCFYTPHLFWFGDNNNNRRVNPGILTEIFCGIPHSFPAYVRLKQWLYYFILMPSLQTSSIHFLLLFTIKHWDH
jgi:hypothetical protein